MAIIYEDNPSYFGPPEITPMTEEARGSENPATKPLSVGISSDMVNNDTTNSSSEFVLETEETYDTDGDETGESNMRKRKVMENPAPKLIDNKRRHMERQLSAAQRDQLHLNEAKEDSQFKRDIAKGMRQSN
eukprot:gene2149-2445_t